jgi:hypothetical protein
MRNILGLRIETKVSLAIVIMVAIIMIITVLKSVESFNKFSNKINAYEELRVEESE